MGRRKGSPNKGYFYRSGRGWFTQPNGSMIPLRDEHGEPIRSKSTPVADLRAAYKRVIIAAPAPPVNGVTVHQVCYAYLADAKDKGAVKTYEDRSDTLFDFCTGLPPKFRNSTDEPKASDSIHKGYGEMAVDQLRKLDIDEWLRAHKTWKGGRRTRIQAVKRALNYGVESQLIPVNPIRGYRTEKQNARVTYITPEQEKALCKAGNESLAMAIKVCIRTGARPGCEFGALTARHVKDHGKRMEWIFAADEGKRTKAKRIRVIRITDKELMRIVRAQISQHPTGYLFRNTEGDRWTAHNLALAFRKCKERLIKRGMEFDKDLCMYSCRHTFAKRVLQGYWTDRQTNIETLARLMGNTPQVCRDHYLQWTESYNEPLWESV